MTAKQLSVKARGGASGLQEEWPEALVRVGVKEIVDEILSDLLPVRKKASRAFNYQFLPPTQFLDAVHYNPKYIKIEDGRRVLREEARLELTRRDLLTHIYTFGQYLWRYRAYFYFARIQTVRSFDSVVLLLVHGDVSSALRILRGLQEQIGQVHLLRREIETALEDVQASDEQKCMRIEDKLLKVFYATRIDWPNVLASGLTSNRPDKLAYRRDDYFADIKAADLLKGVDALGKQVTGSRLVYDFLSEFAHPNIGNYYLTIEDTVFAEDANGLLWETRNLGTGFPNAGFQYLSTRILEAFSIMRDIVRLAIRDIEKAEALYKAYVPIVRPFIRRVLNAHRHWLDLAQQCPCGSGKPIKACCGRIS